MSATPRPVLRFDAFIQKPGKSRIFPQTFLTLWLFRPFSSHDGVIGLNLTNTFLVFTEDDIGDLLKIRLTWQGEAETWSSVWKNIRKSFWNWTPNPTKPILEVRRIRVKAGETQKK